VADAMASLKNDGFPVEDLDIYSGSPYPEGSFGEAEPSHRVYVWPFIGAICGFTLALLFTAGTQVSYPLVTGGKPIVSLPPYVIIGFETTILIGALVTVAGMLINARLPKLGRAPGYDARFSNDRFGVAVHCSLDRAPSVREILRSAGSDEVRP